MEIFTRLTVTTCLYLSPSNRARSLSTLIAVIVDKDTPLNKKLVLRTIKNPEQLLGRFGGNNRPQKRGCAIRPTLKSVNARQASKSFDGGWREDTLWRTTMIRTFPTTALMDRGIPNISKITLWANVTPKTHENSWFTNVGLSSSVEFAINYVSRAYRFCLFRRQWSWHKKSYVSVVTFFGFSWDKCHSVQIWMSPED